VVKRAKVKQFGALVPRVSLCSRPTSVPVISCGELTGKVDAPKQGLMG
jgi:hypothetical protein